jgi:hypothetical protein
MATVDTYTPEPRPLTSEERTRCARVARRLIEQEKIRRANLCRLYQQRDEEHERRQTALVAAIEDCSAWIAKFRRAADRLQWQPDTYELPPQQDRRAA